MAGRESTPPATTTAAAISSPLTPAPKRARMASPVRQPAEGSGSEDTPAAVAAQRAFDDEVEADDGASDSGFDSDFSDTTSISSSIYKGYVENGRRYQTLRDGEYWGPSDEKQFEAMQAAHLVYRILDSNEKNPLFHSPISETAQNILDVGTGNGAWAVDVAERFPSSFVQGIDLYPPPETWVPSNCKFEVDDVLKPWYFQQKFDLIHLRDLQGAFTNSQWTGFYKQAYENLVPGGWIEDVVASVGCYCDDGTLLEDSLLANFGNLLQEASEKMGNPLDSVFKSRARIEAAGFVNVQEKLYKVPLGSWAKSPVFKEAGRFCRLQLLSGVEGFCLFLFTKFLGWSVEEVHVYLAKLRKEIDNQSVHAYYLKRRVWAQKPLDAEVKAE